MDDARSSSARTHVSLQRGRVCVYVREVGKMLTFRDSSEAGRSSTDGRSAKTVSCSCTAEPLRCQRQLGGGGEGEEREERGEGVGARRRSASQSKLENSRQSSFRWGLSK